MLTKYSSKDSNPLESYLALSLFHWTGIQCLTGGLSR
jgi:hypothetical protein